MSSKMRLQNGLKRIRIQILEPRTQSGTPNYLIKIKLSRRTVTMTTNTKFFTVLASGSSMMLWHKNGHPEENLASTVWPTRRVITPAKPRLLRPRWPQKLSMSTNPRQKFLKLTLEATTAAITILEEFEWPQIRSNPGNMKQTFPTTTRHQWKLF